MAESFQQNYSAEVIIDEIRRKIFSHKDPYNLFSKQNTTIINDVNCSFFLVPEIT